MGPSDPQDDGTESRLELVGAGVLGVTGVCISSIAVMILIGGGGSWWAGVVWLLLGLGALSWCAAIVRFGTSRAAMKELKKPHGMWDFVVSGAIALRDLPVFIGATALGFGSLVAIVILAGVASGAFVEVRPSGSSSTAMAGFALLATTGGALVIAAGKLIPKRRRDSLREAKAALAPVQERLQQSFSQLAAAREALEKLETELDTKMHQLTETESRRTKLARDLEADPRLINALAESSRRDQRKQVWFWIAGLAISFMLGYIVNLTTPALSNWFAR